MPRIGAGLMTALLVAGCGVTPSHGPASATPVASRSPLPTAIPSAPAILGDSWVSVAGVPFVVAAGGSGWVAIGKDCASNANAPDCDAQEAAVWRSVDGRIWTRISRLPGAGADTDMRLIASSGAALYAIGETWVVKDNEMIRVHATVWRSPDGITWESVGSASLFDLGRCFEGCPQIGSIAAGPLGVLFSGGTALWFSPDGRDWERADGVSLSPEPGQIAAGGPGFVRIDPVEGRAAPWSSADGRNWTGPNLLPTPRELAQGERFHATRIAASDQRLVVLGERCGQDSCALVIWTSVDGVAWTEGNIDGAGGFQGRLAESQGTFVVLGTFGGQLTAWTSTDGTTWSPRSSVGLPVLGGESGFDYGFSDMAGGPLGVILVPFEGPAQVWISVTP